MKTEYIEGHRAEFLGRYEGVDIFSVHSWSGRVLFQGSRDECRRYVKLHLAKVAEHERLIRKSRREVV
jgi:hypothetical protein